MEVMPNIVIKKFSGKCMDREGCLCGYNSAGQCTLFGVCLEGDSKSLSMCNSIFGKWYIGRP